MKALFTTLAFAVLLAPLAGAAQTASSTATTSSTAKKSTVRRISGTVVSATDSSLVITTSSNKQDTFTLNSSTKKTADLTPGTKVRVFYKKSGTELVATSVRPAATAKKSAAPKASSTSTSSGS